MEFVICYFKKTFRSDTSSKEAYMKANIWFAKTVLNDEVLKDTYSKIVKLPKEGDSYQFRLELYASIEEKDSRDSFCNACREFHTKFYINQQFNCERCNMSARMNQIELKLQTKKQYRKEMLKHSINRTDD